MLDLQRYFVKEHAGFFKGKGTFDILNPDTEERIGIARETTGGFGTVLKLMLGKEKGPVRISISATEKGPAVVEIRRPYSIVFRPKIHVHEGGKHLGYFNKKRFSIGGGLNVFDGNGKRVGDVQGSWGGGTFKFTDAAGKELGVISKKPVGMMKKLFTSADNYMVSISEGQPTSTGALLLAAAIVLDTLYYDGKKVSKAGVAAAGAAATEDEE